jgi:glutathione peroxidase
MSARQNILKTFYPVLLWINKLTGTKSLELTNRKANKPIEPIYDYSVQLNNGNTLNLSELKGKKILFVNTASDCGYTKQYEQLQELYTRLPEKLIIIGFPANDFKQQEKGSDEEIATFCKINYGVTFPLAKKSTVVNGPSQNDIFRWLTHAEKNGWCNQQPSWNFSKYLINEQGSLIHYFDPAVSPTSEEVIHAIKA